MRLQLRSVGWLLGLVAIAVGFCRSSACAAEPFDYFQNSWNVVGLKDYNDGTRITPNNELLLANGDKAQLRFGKELTALSRKQAKTLLEGWMPIMKIWTSSPKMFFVFEGWGATLASRVPPSRLT